MDAGIVPVHVMMVVAVMVRRGDLLMGVAAMFRLLDGLRLQPFADIRDLAVETEEAARDDRLRSAHRRVEDCGAGIEIA